MLEANDDSPLLNGMCDDTCHGILYTALWCQSPETCNQAKERRRYQGL